MALINGNGWIPGTTGDDEIHGGPGSDSLYGEQPGQTIDGTNRLFGEGGDDNLNGAPGPDIMDGGAGFDLASYQLSSGPVDASLADPSINTGDARGDTYTNIEGITGSPFGGHYYGANNGETNQLWALGGTNFLFGGTGYTTMISGPGDDHMTGGAKRGLVDYEVAGAGLTASLANSSINTGEARGDTYSNLWDLAGSAYNDFLFGDGNNNNMLGLSGNDTMSAGAGNDTLTGGPGADTLTGGTGPDMFVWGGASIGPGDVQTDPNTDIAEARAGIFDRITDFDQSAGHYELGEADQLSVARFMAGLYGSGQPVSSLVRLVEDSSNTFALFQVDVDGSGPEGWLTFARLDGLPNGATVAVILDDGKPAVQVVVGGVSPPPATPMVHVDAWFVSNGQWAGSVDPGSHPAGSQVAGIGDFNHDGTSDLVWLNSSTNSVDEWNISNGKWSGSNDIGPHPAGSNIVGIGDFNGDKSSDILWVNPSNNQTDIWNLSNGKWFASTTIGTHPAGYQVAGVGDVNNDGTSDVVWFNPSNGDVDIWKVQNGIWAGSTNPGKHPGPGWQIAGTGDFNHDGNSDIFFFNNATGQTDLWLLVNGQWAGSVNPGPHPGGAQVGGIGDFNGDGYSDVLWYDPGTQRTDLWTLVNGKWAGSQDLGSHSGGVAGIGDFNGNGTSDILWHL